MINSKFNYQYDRSLKIIFKTLYGQLTLEDIYDSWDYAIENKIIPEETIGFVSDFREAYFDFKVNEYHKIIDYYHQHTKLFNNRKLAAITQSPKDVIIPTSIALKNDGHFCKPFFTLEAAIEWVLK